MRYFKIKYVISAITLTTLILMASCSYLPLPGFSNSTVTTTISPEIHVSTQTTNPTTTYDWNPPVTSTDSTALPDIASVVAKVKPSVVAINTKIITYDIFNRQYTEDGAGSGWILDSNGIIATNNHVIDGASSIQVTFGDGTTLPATVIGADTVADLAVIKVDKTGLPSVSVGDSAEMRIGDWVVALGNALGEGISATAGIVSRSGVSITVDSGQTLSDLIQTNAAINPGNSGGPLVNMKGEVIGITSAKLAAVGVEGMGYAISTKTALPIFQSLITKGYVVRPFLGVSMETVTPGLVSRYNLGTDKGAFLDQVVSGSPAANAGLRPGDVIVEFNNVTVNTAGDAQQAIRAAQVGQTVTILYYRGSSQLTAQVTLVQTPSS